MEERAVCEFIAAEKNKKTELQYINKLDILVATRLITQITDVPKILYRGETIKGNWICQEN